MDSEIYKVLMFYFFRHNSSLYALYVFLDLQNIN